MCFENNTVFVSLDVTHCLAADLSTIPMPSRNHTEDEKTANFSITLNPITHINTYFRCIDGQVDYDDFLKVSRTCARKLLELWCIRKILAIFIKCYVRVYDNSVICDVTNSYISLTY